MDGYTQLAVMSWFHDSWSRNVACRNAISIGPVGYWVRQLSR